MAYEAPKQEPLKDDSLMPSGKHKGTKMINVPARYFIYVYENNLLSNELVKAYIKDNIDAIRQEDKRSGKKYEDTE